MTLFNSRTENFIVNMGDKIAHLIFERIKTSEIKEVSELGEIGWGNKGYGSTGLSADQSFKSKTQEKNEDQKNEIQAMNGEIPINRNKRSQFE